ncbi:hypothetical protein [Phytohabitans houttuyneae]|uniref:Uncharacterized protein n=1 Tax=Phytohabitans houttuyneae TaxID=1076126 RepID=A0A6V8KK32_9ACTN|nr:hypothetical protein [Phytohabitans houttuyneae]GFJ82107.1 hypothetical protein Phou_062870 [Phytohabitans houttuyneae]
MTGQDRRFRRGLFSYDGLLRPAVPGEANAAGRRWRAGFLAAAARTPGAIVVDRPVAVMVCAEHDAIRDAGLRRLVAGGYDHTDALADVDARHARIHFIGDHLIVDQRHVAGDSDAIFEIAPNRLGRYTLQLGWDWYRVDRSHCDVVYDDPRPDPPIVVPIGAEQVDELLAAHRRGRSVTWQTARHGPIEVRPHPPGKTTETR